MREVKCVNVRRVTSFVGGIFFFPMLQFGIRDRAPLLK